MRDICFNRLSVHQSIRYEGINVQTVRWGGTGIGVAFEHCLCTFCGDFEQKICPNRGFVTPRKAYFIIFVQLFSSPKGRPWIWQKKIQKIQLSYLCPWAPPPHLRPNIDTCITQTVLSTFEVALYSHGSSPWIFYCIFVIIMLEISGSIVWIMRLGGTWNAQNGPLKASSPGRGSTKFYTGRSRPEVQPLTVLYTIFDKKGSCLVYLLLINGTPFCCKYTVS